MSNPELELATLQLINQNQFPSLDELTTAIRSDMAKILPKNVSEALSRSYEFVNNPYINEVCGSEQVFIERTIAEIRINLKGLCAEACPFFVAYKCA